MYLLTYFSYFFIYLGCLHEFFFLSFVCFMSHMSEFDALLAVADPETPREGGGANSLINFFFFSVNITIYRNKV